MVFIWKQSLNPFSYSNNNNNNHPIIGSGSSNGNSNSKLSVDAFFFDKFERLKRITLPSAFVGLSSLLPGLSSGIRVCINFNSQYPQGYQQNTCFLCDVYRFNSIAYQCTGQTQIPGNINFTQANCIMNSCQPMMYGGSMMANRYQLPTNIGVTLPQTKFGLYQTASLQQQQQQQQPQQ
ncbi:hypothetical protein DERF_004366 [Dermatophagoides farinae]|nr:hypothetical protein DERF_004366 [Dermatophagoides farinae]